MLIGITDSLLGLEREKFGQDKYRKMHGFGFSALDFAATVRGIIEAGKTA